MAKVFVSHSSLDKDLADAFVNEILLLAMNVPQEAVFCSSVAGHKVSSGEKAIDFIREKLDNSDLTIFLISENFYNSHFCLCEMGAAWALSSKVFFLLVPPLSHRDVTAVFSDRHVSKIDDEYSYGELRDVVEQFVGCKAKTVKFQDVLKKFLSRLGALVRPSKNVSVPIEEFEKVVGELKEYKEEHEAQLQLLEDKETIIRELTELKGEPARKILAKLEGCDGEFEALVGGAADSLKKLGSVLRYFMFDYYNNGEFHVTRSDYLEHSTDIKDAEDRRYIICKGEGFYEFNDDKQKIDDVLVNLNELDRFIRENEGEDGPCYNFFKSFREENGYEISLADRDFWDNYL